jgi:hypothetical protein
MVDSAAFTNTSETWWFNGDQLETPALELRKDIGEYLKQPRESEWYLDEAKLQDLYRFLDENDRDLLRRVDEATDDRTRLQWLQAVADLLNPPLPARAEATSGEVKGRLGPTEEAEPVTPAVASPEPTAPPPSSPFAASGGADIPERLQPAVDDLAAVVADVVASVPGAEELSPEELSQLVAEVLAEP